MRFGTGVDIAAPAARVWEIYRDIERWPEWTASVTSITALDPGPLRIGTRARIRQPRLPATVWTITELDDGRAWTWVAGGPGARTVATHVVEPRGDGARAELSLEMTGPLGLLVAKLTAGLTDRYLALEAEGLKARAEGVRG
ncbi:SRPBCC family protein [Actinokineospora diospyrosa]|uniref:Polyketide cyclase / dehydrase and lipid transport n=1 Tax=Actinokineospora diospyrosa TaxID=103728 RepID=A0ABT1I7V0_9PSEU|nr:SRPBCC family protein [Actinokineospora diospyrosa]MCP2268668.1 Polyketide cyclase / dehydrase and lipid transport [Actinokineospora diospyrosa]